jgi:hypothetical protein
VAAGAVWLASKAQCGASPDDARTDDDDVFDVSLATKGGFARC